MTTTEPRANRQHAQRDLHGIAGTCLQGIISGVTYADLVATYGEPSSLDAARWTPSDATE